MSDDPQTQQEQTPEQQADAAATEQKVQARTKPTTPAVAAVPDSAGNLEANSELTGKFLKLSGYQKSDIIGSNQARRSFVTANGGKYNLTKSGKAIRIQSGPAYPKLVEKAEEEEDE